MPLLPVLLLTLVSVALAGRNFYSILDVSRSATTREIKKAYRLASLKYHPDKDPSPEAAAKFADCSAAYDVLSDEEKRRIYDQGGEEALENAAQRGGSGGFGDPFDMFSSFFGGGRGRGGGGGGGSGGRQQLAPIVVELPVSLVDLYEGRMLHLTHRKQGLCPTCRGTGAKSADDVTTCPKCKGTGSYMQTRRLGPGFVQQMQVQCEQCGGKGKIVKSVCPACRGSKVKAGVDEDNVVLIEAGMPNGHEIVLPGEGDEHPDYAPADVIFRVSTVPHRHFRRDGKNLHMRMRITLLEALVGFDRTFKHLDKHPVRVTKDTVTKPGEVLTMPGEGMPVHNFPSEKGDLFIEFEVAFPASITAEQAEGFRKLLGHESAGRDEL